MIDALVVLLVISVLANAFFFFHNGGLNKRLDRAYSRMFRQTIEFHNLREFVFSEAKFADAKGRSDAGYDSKEVERKWGIFHDIVRRFNAGRDES